MTFKRTPIGEEMPPYHPDGCIANEVLVTIWKLGIMSQEDAQWVMIAQLSYWGIQT